ncbi:hypothetical protein GQF61_14870 [Sphingobacterium sp. DK4209]|uniref:Uncharacterized protein n=1 Tax=Sphingobacterium zhuxiongii TaxID=2662364 RepID=A0A5Q0QBN3_9SPHI|nr:MULTISPECIES: hypothetical protein [unclassified Sphingobacterium]MVZ67141.1 hypothetical protein [Sphingobacterium sp. DK4209]QGA26896.1 hypothetical protein GFH32_11460 [Sphingobacterium sp. dk4302]
MCISAFTYLSAKSQTYLDHGVGLHIGLSKGTPVSAEYEISIFKGSNDYLRRIIAGVGGYIRSMEGVMSTACMLSLVTNLPYYQLERT